MSLRQKKQFTSIYLWSVLWTWPGQLCNRLSKLFNVFCILAKQQKKKDSNPNTFNHLLGVSCHKFLTCIIRWKNKTTLQKRKRSDIESTHPGSTRHVIMYATDVLLFFVQVLFTCTSWRGIQVTSTKAPLTQPKSHDCGNLPNVRGSFITLKVITGNNFHF